MHHAEVLVEVPKSPSAAFVALTAFPTILDEPRVMRATGPRGPIQRS